MQISFNNWRVYYMDNDGRKQIVKTGLSYAGAVKLWQHCNSSGLSADYESY